MFLGAGFCVHNNLITMAFKLNDLKLSCNKSIGKNHSCFVIAEIGQNHQGNIDTAKQLILQAKKSGADCVKFQKTCITEKFNFGALARPYNSVNSWGKTYGDHKQYLEFTDEEFLELQKFSNDHEILFSASAMDMVSVDFLASIKVPFIKIGSGDSNNIPLIEHAAKKYVPLIISTGMIEKEDVNNIYSAVKKYHTQFCLLHCVSAYPAPYDDCNLNVIVDYQKCFPDINIGYSGHELGSTVTIAAVALGAKVIERHFTLDKSQRGSDHRCSLMPEELTNVIKQIRIVETALGSPIKRIVSSEISCIKKLQKSISSATSLKQGHEIEEHDMKIKVTDPSGINAKHYKEMIGRRLKGDKAKDEPFFETDFIV